MTTAPDEIFATTRWTVVVEAGRKSDTQARQALEELCRTYWYPLYAYVRRRGHSKEDAEDLTQTFYAGFLEKNYLAGLDRERGKFRLFLLAALNLFPPMSGTGRTPRSGEAARPSHRSMWPLGELRSETD